MGSPQAQERLDHLHGEVAASDAGSVGSDKSANGTAATASGGSSKMDILGKPDPEAKPFVPANSAGSQVRSVGSRLHFNHRIGNIVICTEGQQAQKCSRRKKHQKHLAEIDRAAA